MIVDMPQLNGDEKIGDLIEHVARLQKLVQFLLNGKISSDNIKARSIETESITAGAITANEITVTELSAITADLGTINAGEINSVDIYGSYIATKKSAYPRAEMDSTNNHFAAFANANQYLKIGSFGAGSVPFLEFRDLASALSAIINLGSVFQIQSQGRFDISSVAGDLNLSSGTANIRLNSATRMFFSNLIDNALGTTLAAQLSAKANGSGINGTVYVATTPGGAANTAITFNNGVRQS